MIAVGTRVRVGEHTTGRIADPSDPTTAQPNPAYVPRHPSVWVWLDEPISGYVRHYPGGYTWSRFMVETPSQPGRWFNADRVTVIGD